MKLRSLFIYTVFLSSILAHSSDNNEEKKIFFISPLDGETVTNPIKISFGATGVSIVPAGKDIPMSGHHHLLINVINLPNLKSPIPADKNHLHFGKGQTETTIELPKGKHTLQMLLGNHLHIPHETPLLSDKIEIIVE